MSTKGIPQSQIQQQQLMHQQQQYIQHQRMLIDSLQMLFSSYKELPETDPLKSKLQTAISELLQPFLPASKVVTE